MLVQNIIWLLSLWPFIFLIKKVVKRKTINVFDLLIGFHCLYFALIPLVSKASSFSYGNALLGIENTIATMIFLNLFNVIAVFFNKWWIKNHDNKSNLLNISNYLFRFYESFDCNFKSLVYFYILIVGISIYRQITGAYLYESMDMLPTNDHGMMFLDEMIACIRVPMAIYLTVYLMKKGGYKKWSLYDWGALVLFISFMLSISRTWQVEIVLSSAITIYSVRRTSLNKTFFFKMLLVVIVLYYVFFPFKSFYRIARMNSIRDGKVSAALLDIDAIHSAINEDIYYEDNKESRQLNLYCLFAKCVDVASVQYGTLLPKAISYSIPKIIFPWKDQYGTQKDIEELSQTRIDVADSAITYAYVDFGLLCPIITFLIFISLFFIWNYYHSIINKRCQDGMTSLLFFNQIFIYSVRLETCVDTYLAAILHSVLTLMCIVALSRLCNFSFKYKNIIIYNNGRFSNYR